MSPEIPIAPDAGAVVVVAVVTSKVCTVAPPDTFSVMFPVPAAMFSLKSITMSFPTATPVASSFGVEPALLKVGLVTSAVVKLNVVSSEIPVKSFPARSSIAVEAIWMAYVVSPVRSLVGFK